MKKILEIQVQYNRLTHVGCNIAGAGSIAYESMSSIVGQNAIQYVVQNQALNTLEL